MKIAVAAFYADVFGTKSRFYEFLPLMLASKRALSITNPDATYTILTDRDTATLINNENSLHEYGLHYSVVAPVIMPLMLKIIFAQRVFVKTCTADLIVLPDVDCFANRDLSDAIPEDVGLAITHRGEKFEYKINNLAYIHDRELAVWFFDRAFRILKGWTQEQQEWGGDQEAWQAALELPRKPPFDQWYEFEDMGNDILISRPEGRKVHLYPCYTHNCFMSDGGRIMPTHESAYMVHLKGPRKQHLDMWMKHRFGDRDSV
jgi:hypothetical protein